MKLCILHCAKHGVYAISVESQNGGIRVTPNKCCGSWHTVKEFKLSPVEWDELSKAAENAARRGRAARKERAMSEVKPIATVCLRGEGYAHGHMLDVQLQIMPDADLPIGARLYDERVVAELRMRAERAEARVAELLVALKKVAQTLDWCAHGCCRGFDDGPLLSTSEAVELAKRTIEKTR